MAFRAPFFAAATTSLALAVACAGSAGCGDNLAVRPDASLPDAGPDEYQPASVGSISLISGTGGAVFAVLRDRPEPLAPRLTARQGVCSIYLRPQEASCTPDCGDQVCSDENQCATKATAVSAGPITVTGLRQKLMFRPGPSGYDLESQPPGQLFDSGARIRVSAPGEVMAGFAAEIEGVPGLEIGFQRLILRRSKDTRLSWTAGGVGRIAVTVETGPPGAPFSSLLRCEADDNGSMTVPRDLVAQLPDLEDGEQQAAAVIRLQRMVLTSLAGPIEIVAGSQVPVDVEVEKR
jgi:hypothetical protein